MLWAVALAPLLFLAQDVNQPPATTGNNGSAPTAQESIETAPGIVWYALVLVGSLVFGGLLVVLLLRQDRLDKERPRP